MRRLIALVAMLGGCAYRPGTFHDRRSGRWLPVRTTTSCLDLAFARRDHPGVAGPVIAYWIGNRCDHRVVVDLASIRAVGRNHDGRDMALVAYDPRHELRPRPLAALWSGEAQIAYGTTTVESICIDVAGIEHDEPARERWLCFAKAER